MLKSLSSHITYTCNTGTMATNIKMAADHNEQNRIYFVQDLLNRRQSKNSLVTNRTGRLLGYSNRSMQIRTSQDRVQWYDKYTMNLQSQRMLTSIHDL